jgi:hypothetical protein
MTRPVLENPAGLEMCHIASGETAWDLYQIYILAMSDSDDAPTMAGIPRQLKTILSPAQTISSHQLSFFL